MHTIIFALAAAAAAAATAGSTTSTITLANAGQAVLNGCQIEGKRPTYLRSGSPPQQTSATLKLSLAPSSTITRVNFAYTYVTGFGGTVGAHFTLDVAGTAVYNSPILNKYPYGGAYSPPVNAAWSQSIAVPSSGGGTARAPLPSPVPCYFLTLLLICVCVCSVWITLLHCWLIAKVWPSSLITLTRICSWRFQYKSTLRAMVQRRALLRQHRQHQRRRHRHQHRRHLQTHLHRPKCTQTIIDAQPNVSEPPLPPPLSGSHQLCAARTCDTDVYSTLNDVRTQVHGRRRRVRMLPNPKPPCTPERHSPRLCRRSYEKLQTRRGYQPSNRSACFRRFRQDVGQHHGCRSGTS